MPLLQSAPVASDWLKSEAPAYYSRDRGVVASGSGKLVSGQVLGRVTASKKLVPHAPGAADGSQNAVAVLVFPVDATAADAAAVVVSRDAQVSSLGLVHGPTVTDATKRAAAIDQLTAVGIITRQGA